jgi:hypothetical protein
MVVSIWAREVSVMAKKPKTSAEVQGKTRFEVRFDTDVYDQLKALADESQVSVNQLMHGLARWAVKHGHAGEPHWGSQHELVSIDQPGCVWFGNYEGAEEDEHGDPMHIPAQVYCSLDFTERRVVREDDERRGKERKK